MHQVHERVLGVEHHVRGPARLQHPVHLGDRLLDVRRVVQDPERVDRVERGVREVERLGVAEAEVDRDAGVLSRTARATASAFSVRSTAVTSKPHFASWMLSTPIPHPTSSSLPWLPASESKNSRRW